MLVGNLCNMSLLLQEPPSSGGGGGSSTVVRVPFLNTNVIEIGIDSLPLFTVYKYAQISEAAMYDEDTYGSAVYDEPEFKEYIAIDPVSVMYDTLAAKLTITLSSNFDGEVVYAI